MGGIGGALEGLDPKRSAFAMGQGAGAVRDIKPAAEIIREMIEEAEAVLTRMAALARA
jgi:enoyl-[acyl-carrier protein] reductase II